MRHTDPLFVALTKRETLGDGMFPYELSIITTMAAVLSVIIFGQWLVSGASYAFCMTAMAVLQARDEDMFAILALRTTLWSRGSNRNNGFWHARSYQP